MTAEELKTRIDNTKAKITKIEKRVEKWSKDMDANGIELAKNLEISYRDFKVQSDELLKKGLYIYNDEWNQGPQIDELRHAYQDLKDSNDLLTKYETMLSNLLKFESSEKIEIIWSFLQEWANKVRKYILNNFDLYIELKQNFSEEYNKYKEDNPELKYSYGIFKKEYYSQIHDWTIMCTNGNSFDGNKLEELLKKEVKAKYENLIKMITDKAGEILDASDLSIGMNGDINGIIHGSKNDVSIKTISAGGYNIQCFHYRVLVHTIA